MTRAPLAALAIALAVSACSTPDISAPSLLPREIERRSDAEPVRPVPVATPDPALDAEIAGLTVRRERASADYASADRIAAARLGAGQRAAIGSDAWLDAQTALADLDTPRADLTAIVAELDQLAIDRAAAGKPDYPALQTAKAVADEELARISALVAQRKARLPVQ